MTNEFTSLNDLELYTRRASLYFDLNKAEHALYPSFNSAHLALSYLAKSKLHPDDPYYVQQARLHHEDVMANDLPGLLDQHIAVLEAMLRTEQEMRRRL